MSYDLSLPLICNHKISNELAYLAGDLRTLRMAHPLSSVRSVQVHASDDLVPSTEYSIISDPLAIDINTPKIVYFKYNWRTTYDVFELSYITLSSTCPKCNGQEALHDISYSTMGTLSLGRNEKLLLQNLEKFIITELASNPFHTYIGTGLVGLLGEKVQDINYLRSKVTQEVMSSLDKFKELQKKYASSGRPMTAGETLQTVNSVSVLMDTADPTIMRVNVEATAASGKSVTYVQLLKIL